MSFLSSIPILGDVIDFASKNFFANKANNQQWELQQAQIDAQKELQTSQNTWNEQMWQKNNEYNSPSNQVQLYRDAGLNPAFFLGQGNSVSGAPASSSSMSAPSVPQPADNYGGVGSALGKMGSDFLNAMLTESVINKNNKEAGLTDTEIEFNKKTMNARVQLQDAMVKLTAEQQKEVTARANKLVTENDFIRSQIGLNEQQKQLNDIAIQFLPLQNSADLQKSLATIDNLMSQSDVNRSQVRFLKAHRSLVLEQINTEKHKQSNLDSSSALNNANAAVAGEQKELVKGQSTYQNTQNEIQDSTKETEIEAKNVENTLRPYVSAITDIFNSIANNISAFGSIRKGKSTRNPR